MPEPIKLTIAVEQVAFGKVWTALDVMPGVIEIKIHGKGPPKQKAAKPFNEKMNGSTPTISNIILNALQDKKALPTTILGEILEANDKRKASLPNVLYKLKNEEKLIASAGVGIYKITAKGRKAIQQE